MTCQVFTLVPLHTQATETNFQHFSFVNAPIFNCSLHPTLIPHIEIFFTSHRWLRRYIYTSGIFLWETSGNIYCSM